MSSLDTHDSENNEHSSISGSHVHDDESSYDDDDDDEGDDNEETFDEEDEEENDFSTSETLSQLFHTFSSVQQMMGSTDFRGYLVQWIISSILVESLDQPLNFQNPLAPQLHERIVALLPTNEEIQTLIVPSLQVFCTPSPDDHEEETSD